MSKAIYFGMPFHGHVNPSLALVQELVKQGEEIIYYCKEEFKEKITNTGAEYRDYGKRFFLNSSYATDNFLKFSSLLMETTRILLEDLLEEVRKEKPQYILHDAQCPWGKYMAAILGVPGVSIITTFVFSMNNVFRIPSFAQNVLKLFIRDFPSFIRAESLCGRLDRKYKVRCGSTFDAFTSKEKLNIVLTLREFQPEADRLDASYKFVGPLLSQRKEKETFLLNTTKHRPIIYVSLGTLFNKDHSFYRNCMVGLKDMNCQVVMAVGKGIDPADLERIPENFIVQNYVPQLEILEKASLFITHAGMNSAHEGLYYGVPLIAVPQQPEQMVVAEQIEKSGCGVYLRKKDLSPEGIRKSVETVLRDRRYRECCVNMALALKQSGGYKKAAEYILENKKQTTSEIGFHI